MLHPIAPIISKIQKMPILQPKLIKMKEHTTSNHTTNLELCHRKTNQYP